jgi:transposase-like protein
MEANVLPAMPIDFNVLTNQIMPMLTNVIGSIAPFLLIYIVAMVGLRYLNNTFKGNHPTADIAKPWEEHPDSIYEWYRETIERKGEDYFERAPEWVKARMEYEEIYDEIAAKEKRRQIHKMIEADIKKKIASGENIFEERKKRACNPASPPPVWFGDEDEDEPYYPEFEG